MSDDCQCPVCGRMHRHLGTPPLSISEQIARDMKQGTFPQKSKDTLLEEAIARIEALEAALREAERFVSYLANETDGHFVGSGTPTTCLVMIRAALAPEQEK